VSEEIERDEHKEVQESVADAVRRSLIQLGDMEGMKDRLRNVSERMSKITPPVVPPKECE
jgi:hypothetical protein